MTLLVCKMLYVNQSMQIRKFHLYTYGHMDITSTHHIILKFCRTWHNSRVVVPYANEIHFILSSLPRHTKGSGRMLSHTSINNWMHLHWPVTLSLRFLLCIPSTICWLKWTLWHPYADFAGLCDEGRVVWKRYMTRLFIAPPLLKIFCNLLFIQTCTRLFVMKRVVALSFFIHFSH